MIAGNDSRLMVQKLLTLNHTSVEKTWTKECEYRHWPCTIPLAGLLQWYSTEKLKDNDGRLWWPADYKYHNPSKHMQAVLRWRADTGAKSPAPCSHAYYNCGSIQSGLTKSKEGMSNEHYRWWRWSWQRNHRPFTTHELVTGKSWKLRRCWHWPSTILHASLHQWVDNSSREWLNNNYCNAMIMGWTHTNHWFF